LITRNSPGLARSRTCHFSLFLARGPQPRGNRCQTRPPLSTAWTHFTLASAFTRILSTRRTHVRPDQSAAPAEARNSFPPCPTSSNLPPRKFPRVRISRSASKPSRNFIPIRLELSQQRTRLLPTCRISSSAPRKSAWRPLQPAPPGPSSKSMPARSSRRSRKQTGDAAAPEVPAVPSEVNGGAPSTLIALSANPASGSVVLCLKAISPRVLPCLPTASPARLKFTRPAKSGNAIRMETARAGQGRATSASASAAVLRSQTQTLGLGGALKLSLPKTQSGLKRPDPNADADDPPSASVRRILRRCHPARSRS